MDGRINPSKYVHETKYLDGQLIIVFVNVEPERDIDIMYYDNKGETVHDEIKLKDYIRKYWETNKAYREIKYPQLKKHLKNILDEIKHENIALNNIKNNVHLHNI